MSEEQQGTKRGVALIPARGNMLMVCLIKRVVVPENDSRNEQQRSKTSVLFGAAHIPVPEAFGGGGAAFAEPITVAGAVMSSGTPVNVESLDVAMSPIASEHASWNTPVSLFKFRSCS